MPSVSPEFAELESSNNLVPVLQPEMRMSSRIPSRIMNNYKVSHNTGLTSPYASSTKSSTNNQLPIRVVRPVRLTDKQFVHELYGRRPSQSNYSCVNKTAGRQVPFPRSNRTSMCVGGPAGRYRNPAQWTPPQPWIGTDQSASSISSQAARIHSSQSPPCLQIAIDQSEASNPGSCRYKSRCCSQFVSSVVSNSTSASSNTLSSIGYHRYFSNRTLQFDISPRENYLSNNPVQCPATRVEHLSNTPVRCIASPCYWSNTPVQRQSIVGANYLTNGPVRRQEARPNQLSNTPVRRQPSSPNSTWMYLLRCLWSTCRIRRRQTRRRRFQKSNLM